MFIMPCKQAITPKRQNNADDVIKAAMVRDSEPSPGAEQTL